MYPVASGIRMIIVDVLGLVHSFGTSVGQTCSSFSFWGLWHLETKLKALGLLVASLMSSSGNAVTMDGVLGQLLWMLGFRAVQHNVKS